MNEYVGVIHIHTTLSDGHQTPQQTIDAAIDAGLDFLVISDHDNDSARTQGFTGRHGRLICISAPEIGGVGRPHFLAFGSPPDIDRLKSTASPSEALAVAAAGGMRNFIAHPHSARIFWRKCKPVNWEDWQTQDFCGLEIWSYLHDICDYAVPWAAPLLFWAPALLATGPRRETLEIWDKLTQQRPVAAIAALDNHARRFFCGTIVPHRHAFRALRSHILCDALPDDARLAEKAIVDALCAGSSWAAMDQWADSRGFDFHLTAPDGRTIGLGCQATFADGYVLHVSSPHRADISVIRNGQLLEMRRDCDALEIPLRMPGVYRVQADIGRRSRLRRHRRRRQRKWIVTNPIYLNLNANQSESECKNDYRRSLWKN